MSVDGGAGDLRTVAAATAFDSMWAELEPVGRSGETGGYRRYAWTGVDLALREWFAQECTRRGLDLMVDRVGNQWAWWVPGALRAQGLTSVDDCVRAGRPGVVIGSHLDSVPDGGAFDGPLGVVSALAALDLLREQGADLQRPLAVVNFIDEEGARFGVACAGSRVLTGQMTPERALALADAEGTTMARALEQAGRSPAELGRDEEVLARIGVFVELHVEQGRGLVDLGLPVALGSDIHPHGRWRLDFPGEANHAGTTRLEDRRDAMLGYASTVLAARQIAAATGCVATMGKVVVDPGGVNAIPSQVTGWLDARGADEAAVRETVRRIREHALEAGGEGTAVTEESWTPTTRFDAGLMARLQGVLGEALAGPAPTVPVPVLGTGAGHDAGVLATAGLPTAMLFVRNPTGVSHSPAEHAERDDCHAGVLALAACVRELADDSARQAGPVAT